VRNRLFVDEKTKEGIKGEKIKYNQPL